MSSTFAFRRIFIRTVHRKQRLEHEFHCTILLCLPSSSKIPEFHLQRTVRFFFQFLQMGNFQTKEREDKALRSSQCVQLQRSEKGRVCVCLFQLQGISRGSLWYTLFDWLIHTHSPESRFRAATCSSSQNAASIHSFGLVGCSFNSWQKLR